MKEGKKEVIIGIKDRQRAEFDRNLEGTEKLEEGEGNNKKDGKEVMMELDISSHVANTGRLTLKELNQNSSITDGERKGNERNVGNRWRKKERQEKNEIIQDNENNREVRKSCRHKKEWQKEKEEEGVLDELGDGKRMKLQRLGKDFNYKEEKVANLDWPQSHQ